jgi:formylglycine-generating enzyme required for sulfatase activity
MVGVPGSQFTLGTDGREAGAAEHPALRGGVDAFWMDATEVTNAQFRWFVKATGSVKTAERAPSLPTHRNQFDPSGKYRPMGGERGYVLLQSFAETLGNGPSGESHGLISGLGDRTR